MPTIERMEIPCPENWQDFERIVECYAQLRWPNCIVTKNGSGGQSQFGVDIYVRDNKHQFIGVQCKKVSKISFTSIEKEIIKAEGFKPAMKHFILAITLKRDAKLQEKINILSLQRSQKELFSIEIIFWEDIISLLKTNKKLLEQLYPELFYTDTDLDRITINTGVNSGSITGKIVYINYFKDESNINIKKNPIEGTVGNDPFKKGYVRHLIDRYLEFKKADLDIKEQMKYFLIYNSIKKEIGFKWDETPCELFDDLCIHLQRRIDNTKLGRIRKKNGYKNFSTYDEFIAEKTKGKFDRSKY